MLIKCPPSWSLSENEVTPEALYLDRRRLMVGLGGALLAPNFSSPVAAQAAGVRGESLRGELTPLGDVTHHNNFYEFGTAKDQPSKRAGTLRTRPWTVKIGGLVKKPLVLDIDQIRKLFGSEERIYRMRCVEGWSMVIPWNGFSLAKLIAYAQPLANAKYVAFQTLHDPRQMPGQRSSVLDWPYTEGLRMDEARNVLSFMATGLYGRSLPQQNGAPIRLVVPWKYGFKSIKSIVAINFVSRQPATSWNRSAPEEYGFYANVNPNVDHPRWSQGRERRIGDWLPRKTLMFNGYANEVAGMYRNMDLRRYY